MHSPESTTSGLGIALRGGNGVVLPLRAWARASIYLLVGGIERKAGRYRIQLRIPESREEGKLTGMNRREYQAKPALAGKTKGPEMFPALSVWTVL